MTIYTFEEIGPELPRPPFAALRALQSVGVLVTPKGWQQLDPVARTTLAEEGARERVDMMAVRAIVNGIPANQIKLVSRTIDPVLTEVAGDLQRALGPQRAIPLEEWSKLEALDRFTLASLAYNTRLLWRAIDELERKGKLGRRRGAWTGSVARCELMMRPDVMVQLMGTDFLQGRALVLARGAGRRAARRASETFDLQTDTEAGPIELDWGVLEKPGGMLWQAHVSGWDGAFLPAASLQAALTAAVAIFDMVKELDPSAAITIATVSHEPWLVGNDGPADIATRLYTRPARSRAGTVGAAAAPSTPPPPPTSTPASAPTSTPRPPPASSAPRPVASAAPRAGSSSTPSTRPPPPSVRPPAPPPVPPAPAPAPPAPQPASRGIVGSGTVRLESPLVPPPPPAPPAPAAPQVEPAPPAALAPTPPPPAPGVAAPPAPALPASIAPPSPNHHVQRMKTVPTGEGGAVTASKPPRLGTADATVLIERSRPDTRPIWLLILVVGLVGAGMLGYAVGR